LNYGQLSQLQNAGLIQHDLTAWRQIPPPIFGVPFLVGNKQYKFSLTIETPKDLVQVTAINFTQLGLELRKVLHLSNNPMYNEKFEEWVIQKFKLQR